MNESLSLVTTYCQLTSYSTVEVQESRHCSVEQLKGSTSEELHVRKRVNM